MTIKRKLRDVTPRPARKYLSISVPAKLNFIFEGCTDVVVEITEDGRGIVVMPCGS